MLTDIRENAMHDFERQAEKAPVRRTEKVALRGDRESSSASVKATGRPRMLDAASILHLQRAAGNAGVIQLLADDDGSSAQIESAVAASSATAQREDEPGADGAAITQRQMEPEEEEEEASAE
jgi:hypothetical protein